MLSDTVMMGMTTISPGLLGRLLKLLDPRSRLVAIAIEGVSPVEDGLRAGDADLVIDTAEYYGSEVLADANLIIYNQLKYSTTAAEQPFTAAMLAPMGESRAAQTLQGFARKYAALSKRLTPKVVEQKVRFRLVTNRPIAAGLISAFEYGRTGRRLELAPAPLRRDLARLVTASGLDRSSFRAFLRTVEVHGSQGSGDAQRLLLFGDAAKFVSAADIDAAIKLKALVQTKALSAAASDPTLRKESVLQALGVSSVARLMPSPTNLEPVSNPIRRIQEGELVSRILNSKNPMVIHAAGGVGKSILAQRLPQLMPLGSEAVVFDGFAGGNYRSPRDPRHHHERGLIQIANEFSVRGLCLPFLPTEKTAADYLSTFWRRIEEVADAVKKRTPQGLVLVVLDAADNSEMAARDLGERSFARDLLQEQAMPDRVRLVAVARTERLDLLQLPSTTNTFGLQGFSQSESAELLKRRFPSATPADATEFHRLTAGNPRVQANELDSQHESIAHLLRTLSPGVVSVEQAIEKQISRALERVKQQMPSDEQRNALCTGLAMLPPRVPIGVLARGADVEPSAVSSFVSDLGRPLLELDNAVQFRDEPVETWFRRNFTDTGQVDRIIQNLLPSAKTDPYVASAMPRLLHRAGRYDQLIEEALEDLDAQFDDPVARREVGLQRSQFALRSAIIKSDKTAVAKLLLRIGEQVSTRHRQAGFVTKNADLIGHLFGPERVQDLVLRREAGGWFGSAHAHMAALLAPNRLFRDEARSFLRLAYDWLREWARLPNEKRAEVSIRHEDITAIVLARLFITGTKDAIHEITRWRPQTLHWHIAREVASKLIDIGRGDEVQKMAEQSHRNPLVTAALVLELENADIPAKPVLVKRLAHVLLQKRSLFRKREILAVTKGLPLAVAEAACRSRGGGRVALALVAKYTPPIGDRFPVGMPGDTSGGVNLLKAYALKAALSGQDFNESHVMPSRLRKLIAEKHGEHGDVREFHDSVGSLVPWYGARADVIAGRISGRRIRERIESVAASTSSNSWRLTNNWRTAEVIPTVVNVWLDIACRGKVADQQTVASIEHWLDERESHVSMATWTALTKRAASCVPTRPAAIRFAKRARDLAAGMHLPASTAADSFAALARAILIANRAEATTYLGAALDVLDRLDDDAMNRFEATLRMAEGAAKSGTGNAQIAYLLARVAEVVGREFYDSGKFPWGRVASVLVRLDPPSSLAIAARWRDRNTVGFDDVLPPALSELVKQKLLAPRTAAALRVIAGDLQRSDIEKFAKVVMEACRDDSERGAVFGLLVDELTFDDGNAHDVKAIAQLGQQFRITDRRLADAVTRLRIHEESAGGEKVRRADIRNLRHLRVSGPKGIKLRWNQVFAGLDICTAAGIDDAVRRFRLTELPLDFEHFYRRMRERVPAGAELEHIKALAGASELTIGQAIEALRSSREQWLDYASVLQGLPSVVTTIIAARATDLMEHWYGVAARVKELSELADMPRGLIAAHAAEHCADRLSVMPSESIFALASEFATEMNADEAQGALRFGLGRFDRILREEDADGPWSATLGAGTDVPRAIASLLWAALGAPDADTRWRAAHAVRRLFVVKDELVIDRLASMLGEKAVGPFGDASLPFYCLTARLYLFVALARGALIWPEPLKKHVSAICEVTLNDLPHVVIRHFGAATALAVEKAYPGTVPSEDLKRLRTVNTPVGEVPEDKSNQSERQRKPSEKDKNRFTLAYDMDRHWFEPLARVFGRSQAEAIERAEQWVVDRWGITLDSWKDDPRHRRGILKERATWASQGSHPAVEDYRFYLSYHALMCVAGDFLAGYPVVMDYSGPGAWQRWLESRALTRSDGKWLADRRDPPPVDIRMSVGPSVESEGWQQTLDAKDFDAQLRPNGATKLVLWGWWKLSLGFREETISLRSALVRPKYSSALLRALQLSREPYGHGIPSSNSREGRGVDGFQMTPIFESPERDYGLDRFDPLGGRISFPVHQPNRSLRKVAGLAAVDEELRVWTCSTHNGSVVSEVWGDWREREHRREANYGYRLSTNTRSVQDLLTAVKRDLIVQVSIERSVETSGSREATYALPRWRNYLINRHGRFTVLPGSPWVRRTNPKTTTKRRAQRSSHRMGGPLSRRVDAKRARRFRQTPI